MEFGICSETVQSRDAVLNTNRALEGGCCLRYSLKIEIFKHGKDFCHGLCFLAILEKILSRLKPCRGSCVPWRRVRPSQIGAFFPPWFCWGKIKINRKAPHVSRGWKKSILGKQMVQQFCMRLLNHNALNSLFPNTQEWRELGEETQLCFAFLLGETAFTKLEEFSQKS